MSTRRWTRHWSLGRWRFSLQGHRTQRWPKPFRFGWSKPHLDSRFFENDWTPGGTISLGWFIFHFLRVTKKAAA